MGDYLKDETPFGGLGDRTTRMGIVMRERADKAMKDNFSNYTPNMLDDLVGMVPSVAGYLGVAALSPELAAITMIGGAGAALTAEEFAKFKDKGRSTPAASALALAVGVPTTGVMALGWGAVSKLTEPWLTDVIGSTIGKLASQVAGGSAMFGGQTFTEGSLELATGAEPYKDAGSLVNLLAKTGYSALLGGIFGGAIALPYAMKQHSAFIEGCAKLGIDKKTANDILGQSGHVMHDKVEEHIQMTQEEKGDQDAARQDSPPNSSAISRGFL